MLNHEAVLLAVRVIHGKPPHDGPKLRVEQAVDGELRRVSASHLLVAFLLVGILEGNEIFLHESILPVTLLVLLNHRIDGVAPEAGLYRLDQVIRRLGTHHLVQQLALVVDNQHRGISLHLAGIKLVELQSLLLLHVVLHAHEALVHVVAHLLLRKDLRGQCLARAAPRGVAIHENHLVRLLGLLHDLGPRLIVEEARALGKCPGRHAE